MSKWEISPIDEGVTNHNNGKFTFPANAPHKTYTISYTDDAKCTVTYSYKLKDCSTPSECDKPKANDKLDTLIENCGFATALGTEISPDNAPCTYTYLKDVYEYVQLMTSDVLKSWTLANVLAELTPYDDIATKYFEGAAIGYGGIYLDINTYEDIYNQRIDGALQYARYKCGDYIHSQEMAANARAELQAKNIIKAELRPRLHPDKSNPIFFNRGEAPHLEKLIPQDGHPSNAKGGADFIDLQGLINRYQIDLSSYETPTQALSDKAACGAYLTEVMEIDEKYGDFMDLCTDLADAANNPVKYDMPKYRRWRPQHYVGEGYEDFFDIPAGGDVYLCDCRYQYESYRKCGENCNSNTCETEIVGFSQQTSFPSGHSAKAYMSFLCCMEVVRSLYNVTKIERMEQYCWNRNVVRAHWRSDVTAGKFCASILIGYLNGFEEYHKLINNLNE